jgi:hypothetical protein
LGRRRIDRRGGSTVIESTVASTETMKSLVSRPAPGVQQRRLLADGDVVDEFLLVWFEQASEPWCELADVLVLAEQQDHRAAVLRRFPGCLATLALVGDRYLAHTRRLGTLAFPPSVSVGRCAELAHGLMLSGGAPDDSAGSSAKR